MSEQMESDTTGGEESLATMATLVTNLKLQVADVEALHARLTECVATADLKLTELNAAAAAVLAIKTQITDEQGVIATKSSHIQDAQIHADKVRAELDRIQSSAAQQATEAEGQRQRAQAASDTASEALTVIQARKAAADGDAAAAVTAKDTAKTAAVATKRLADKADTIETAVSEYERRLAELDAQANSQLETITGLLPGATAAGLAHAFDDRRKTFLKPSSRWQWLFVASVILIVLLALSGLGHVYWSGVSLSWDELARVWLARLPIAGALVWLAVHASRESALAKRLEEDYGYKAAIAASFQGFQKQMADIGSAAPEGSPLSKLCGDTLATIATPPGRIYERYKLAITPTGELAAVATEAAGLAKGNR